MLPVEARFEDACFMLLLSELIEQFEVLVLRDAVLFKEQLLVKYVRVFQTNVLLPTM